MVETINLNESSFKGIIENYLSKKLNQSIKIDCHVVPSYSSYFEYQSASVSVSYEIKEDKYGFVVSRKKEISSQDILKIMKEVFFDEDIESIKYDIFEGDRYYEGTYFNVKICIKSNGLVRKMEM